MIRVLSLGAGVQSTTVLLMSCAGELPKLDAAVFADTQWEPPAVYSHLDWLAAEAARHGIPVLRGSRGDLRADAIQSRASGGKVAGDPGYKRWASMPLWIKNPDGSVGIINRQCTSEYKIEVIERIIRRDLLKLEFMKKAPVNAVENWFGISADEASRRRKSLNHWQTFRYPLIDDVTSPHKLGLFDRGFYREDCLEWCAARGYPRPPRSACVGCPFHTDEEWVRMRASDAASWADAVAFDREMRAATSALQAEGTHRALAGRLVGLPYLHRSCAPLDEVVFRPRDLVALAVYGMANECAGVCGV